MNQPCEWTAYQLNIEDRPFRTRDGEPRPINKDDVRRTIRNWPEYGGPVLDKVSKKRHVRESNLYGDGRITRDEYLRRVELNE